MGIASKSLIKLINHACVQYKQYNTVYVQIFAGLYFREFCKSKGVFKNENVKICMHVVQVCSCRPPFAKLKLRKLLGVGRVQIYFLQKFVHTQYYTYYI